MFHIFLHFFIPAIVVLLCFREDWKKAYLIMMCAFIIDLDHLLASPIYDPNRCSIGFHPLHTAIPIVIYFLLLLIPKARLFAYGLIIHIVLDATDCAFQLSRV